MPLAIVDDDGGFAHSTAGMCDAYLAACHGATGCAEVAELLNSRCSDARLASLRSHILGTIIPGDILGDGRSKEIYSTSLMCGLAGVGRTLLGSRYPVPQLLGIFARYGRRLLIKDYSLRRHNDAGSITNSASGGRR